MINPCRARNLALGGDFLRFQAGGDHDGAQPVDCLMCLRGTFCRSSYMQGCEKSLALAGLGFALPSIVFSLLSVIAFEMFL